MDKENMEEKKSCDALEAADGDKMVADPTTSTPLVLPQTFEHELRITDVEGAAEPPVVIEFGDDEEDEAPMLSELQSALNGTATEPVEEKDADDAASAKTEPSSDAESCNSYNGPDPMGLLERLDRNHDIEIDDDDDGSDDESGSNRSGPGLSKAERWQLWMKRWEWLIHEEDDGNFAFCLYCNIIINVNNKSKYIAQHNMSLYHQERENNYVAFRNSEEQTRGVTSISELKQEFGTDSYAAAIKKKRANEVETLNNFNWLRWLQWHPWLERIQPEGTIGLCKYCNIRLNVEFVYLRKRHENTIRHREGENQFKMQESRKRKRSDSNNDISVDDEPELEAAPSEGSAVVDKVSGWCEIKAGTNPVQCRCTLCDIQMRLSSFRRHCGINVHLNNLEKFRKKDRGIWAQYADLHPWLGPDPRDPSIAYCNVCEKRFMYGHSQIKRKTHENSSNHIAATNRQPTDGSKTAEDIQQESTAEPSEPESESVSYQDIGDDDASSSSDSEAEKKRKTKADSRNAKKSAKVVRHFSWLRVSKDRKMQICKFCRVRIYSEHGKLRHEQSNQHQKTVKQFKAQHLAVRKDHQQKKEEAVENSDSAPTEKASNTSSKAQKAPPVSMQSKVLLWKDRFPWLSYKRNEIRPNYGWCKLCEMSLYLPSFKFASKHQRSTRHIRLRHERKRQGPAVAAKAVAEGSEEVATTTPAVLTPGEAKNKAALAELKAKYEWLEPDPNDENYCFCKQCETRLPIKVFFLKQHHFSRKHADRLKMTAEATTASIHPLKISPRASTTMPEADPEPDVSILEVDQENSEVVSIKSEDSGDEPDPKRMRRSIDVRRLLRVLRNSVGKRQDERSQIDLAKDMICSSFDIVTRLRALDDSSVPGNSRIMPTQAPMSASVGASTQPRDTIDLFFESITQTVKALPTDLAAEGKAKIMQIICDLELRALRRSTNAGDTGQQQTTPPSAVVQSPTQPTPPLSSSGKSNNDAVESVDLGTFEEIAATPNSPTSSVLSSITIEDTDDLPSTQLATLLTNNHSNQTKSNNRIDSDPKVQSAPNTPITNGSAPRHSQEQLRRLLPSMQVTARTTEAETLRCVPLNKLKATPTPSHVVNGRGMSSSAGMTSTPIMQRKPSSLAAALNAPMTTVPHIQNPASVSANVVNANGSILRKIRVSSGNQNKYISVQQVQQQQQLEQQQQQQQQQAQMRNMNRNVLCRMPNNSSNSNGSNRPMQQ